jgi:hypothetical protein
VVCWQGGLCIVVEVWGLIPIDSIIILNKQPNYSATWQPTPGPRGTKPFDQKDATCPPMIRLDYQLTIDTSPLSMSVVVPLPLVSRTPSNK